jgi:hypothetical protein
MADTIDATTGQPVKDGAGATTGATGAIDQRPRHSRMIVTEAIGASFQSPWFWFIIGAGCAFGAMYLINKHK